MKKKLLIDSELIKKSIKVINYISFLTIKKLESHSQLQQ